MISNFIKLDLPKQKASIYIESFVSILTMPCLTSLNNKRQAIEYPLFIEGRRCQERKKEIAGALLIFFFLLLLLDERIIFNKPVYFESIDILK